MSFSSYFFAHSVITKGSLTETKKFYLYFILNLCNQGGDFLNTLSKLVQRLNYSFFIKSSEFIDVSYL